MNLLSTIEAIAQKGAAGLTPEARAEIAQAILQRNREDGGQADLSGTCSDPYYSLFAWFCLRALQGGVPESLTTYFKSCACKSPIDRYSASFVNLQGLPIVRRKLACFGFLLHHPPRTPYALFLAGLLADTAFPRLTALLLRCVRLQDKKAISTSRLAAQLLAQPTARDSQLIRDTLLMRHAPTGGFSSVERAAPDLLATAAARLALATGDLDNRHDLLFAEACWAPNGLFAPQPGLPEGDVEHTFYALLVLGSCRK
jgi:hypothetical protein